MKKEAEESRELAKAQAEAADVVTTTRVLNYAKAADLVTTLKKFLSSRGDILADDRSNTLIIRDIPSTLPVIDNLLRQLDRKSQQVEIEARVVAANRSFSREIGTQFGVGGAAVTPTTSTDSAAARRRNQPGRSTASTALRLRSAVGARPTSSSGSDSAADQPRGDRADQRHHLHFPVRQFRPGYDHHRRGR